MSIGSAATSSNVREESCRDVNVLDACRCDVELSASGVLRLRIHSLFQHLNVQIADLHLLVRS